MPFSVVGAAAIKSSGTLREAGVKVFTVLRRLKLIFELLSMLELNV
jgi:hypothetical protein